MKVNLAGIGGAAMAPIVRTGADLFPLEAHKLLDGKKFGLLTNPTGINANFRSTINVSAELQSGQLVALFACEHGIRAEKQAGVWFGDEVDERLGIPVYSIFDKQLYKPTERMLSDLDAVVYDIQDLGVRFYTYLTTLLYLMEACAEHGKTVIVLDRPNPLGGHRIEGGLLQKGFGSLVGGWKIPASTGLTIGECATLVNDQMEKSCDLHVIRLENWSRDMEYPQTGLPWLMASPNMPTMDTIRVFTGNCLFEGTNLSEGRGTTKPFELFGAPWLDSEKLCKTINEMRFPGVYFHPFVFSPTFQKHKGEICKGVMTYVTEPKVYESAITALHLIHEITKMHPEEFEWIPNRHEPHMKQPIDLLSGSDEVRLTLHTESGLRTIVNKWKADRESWRETIKPYLLY
jgi:uncharacterized protein YbbC (DUF1343 family)